MQTAPYARFRPLSALRALRALAADPDDLPKVFTIIDSLSGRSPEEMLGRMRATEGGRRLLRDKPALTLRLRDRAALRALPAGSVGRAYLELVEREGITPEGIQEASELGGQRPPEELDEDSCYLRDRMRDTHDLWHVVTGYGPDLLGEAALLAFTYAQTKNPGVLLVVMLGVSKANGADRRIMLDGYRRGRSAAWLPAAPWESLLPRPLDEVRLELGVGTPVAYEPVTSAALRESGFLPSKRKAA